MMLQSPIEAFPRYGKHLQELDIHFIGLVVKNGEVRWEHRGDRMLRVFQQRIDFHGKRVLSVGINTGGDMAALLDAGVEHVTGIDMMPELVSLTSAVLLLGADPARWRVLCADAEEYDTDERFDVIYHVGVLYHNENPVRALKNALRLLKPGGWLALETEIIKPAIYGEHEPNAILFHYMRESQYFRRGNNWPTWFIPHEQSLLGMLDCVGFVDMDRIPEDGGAKTCYIARRPE